MKRDAELARLMRPWNWFFGSLLAVLVGTNLLYWWPR